MKKMNKKVLACAGLGAAALVGGTFAYYNQTLSIDNPLFTGKYDNEVVEKFTPEDEEWHPGATLDKVVVAKNTGDYPVLVRVRMDEAWERYNEGSKGFDAVISAGSEKFDAEATGEDLFGIKFDADLTQEFISENQKLSRNDGDTDGLVTGDGSVVRKNMAAGSADKWVFQDGYWYYKEILKPGEDTGAFLSSLTLASNVDEGFYEVKNYFQTSTVEESDALDDEAWTLYTIDANQMTVPSYNITIGDENDDHKVDAIDFAKKLKATGKMAEGENLFRKTETELVKGKEGYADAHYTLTITSQFVQATPDAITEVFGKNHEGVDVMLPNEVSEMIETIQGELLEQ